MRMPPKARESAGIAVFFALVLVVFTTVFPYIAQVNNPNENVRTYMTMALVEDHTFKIDRMVQRHGWTNDMALAPDKATGELHHYSVKAPAISYAGMPIYWAFTKLAPRFGHSVPTEASSLEEKAWWLRTSTFVLRLFVVQLPCFGFLVWFERFLRGVSQDVVLRLTAVAAAGLGTNFLAYSLMFVSHAPFACAAFASFGIIARERRLYPDVRMRRLSRAFLAGFFAGLATLLEYHAATLSVGLAIWALFTFWRPTRYALFGVGAMINAAGLLFFQKRAFGNAFTPGHLMVENQSFAALHKHGLFGLEKPNMGVFADISVSHTYGFFGTSPFMWLGLLAIPFGVVVSLRYVADRGKRRAATIAWLSLMGILWLTVSAAIIWRGGWTIGPRYLGAAPPFFAYGAVCALEEISAHSRVRRSIMRGLAGGLALASVLSMGLVGIVYNTLPESVSRPLTQIALPFVRAGFVPHHAGEWLGFPEATFWYVVAGCLGAAALVAALFPWRDRVWTWGLRVVFVAGAAYLGVKPALSEQRPDEEGDKGVQARTDLSRQWEPPGRDRITALRIVAERQNKPCLWLKLADLEATVEWKGEAERDEKRAGGTPRSVCK